MTLGDWHVHPMVVHFPIALFVTAFVLQLAGCVSKNKNFQASAWLIYILAVIVTPLVVQTGMWEEARWQIRHPVFDRHKLLALVSLWTAVVSFPSLLFLRKRFPQVSPWMSLGVFFILAVMISGTAYFGGILVYEYAVGIKL